MLMVMMGFGFEKFPYLWVRGKEEVNWERYLDCDYM